MNEGQEVVGESILQGLNYLFVLYPSFYLRSCPVVQMILLSMHNVQPWSSTGYDSPLHGRLTLPDAWQADTRLSEHIVVFSHSFSLR